MNSLTACPDRRRALDLWPSNPCAILFALSALLTARAWADSWAPPSAFEVYSKRSNYLARVEPGEILPAKNRAGASLSVFRVDGAARSNEWTIELENEVSPLEVLLTDDGRYAIGLDNWHRMGIGGNVICFYQRAGLIRKYSLEAALADLPETTNGSGLYLGFSHTISSRLWRERSILKIDGEGANATFGIWLDWAGRWFAWRLADGTPVKMQGQELKRWNDIGRAEAMAWMVQPEIPNRPSIKDIRHRTPAAFSWSTANGQRYHDQILACRYLAYAKNPADRPLLEKALLSDEENANWEPQLRINADRALAILDGAASDFKFLEDRQNPRYHRLGTIDLIVDLPQIPGKDEGQLYISVFSETVKATDWRNARPVYRTGTSFKSSPQKSTAHVQITMPAIWPGRYWIKTVWDRKPPFDYNLALYDDMRAWKESREVAPGAGADDFESATREVAVVKSDQTTAINLKCAQRGR